MHKSQQPTAGVGVAQQQQRLVPERGSEQHYHEMLTSDGQLRSHWQPLLGQPRLIGADATHAWIEIHCPTHGWIGFDPTNNCQPQLEHIVLGWGRDFTDVSPLRGVLLGGGSHDPEVAVTVTPLDESSG